MFIFTRLLGAEDYGVYALAVSTLGLIHTLTLSWSEAAAYRFTAEANVKGTLPDHFRTILRLTLISLVPAFIVTCITLFFVWQMEDFRKAIVWILIIMPFSTMVNIALESHRASHRVQRYSIIDIGKGLGGFFLGITLAYIGGFGAAAPIIGIAIATVIAGFSELIWLIRQSKGGQYRPDVVKKYLVYGLPVSFALIMDLALSAADRFLIAYFLDTAAVGAYAAGYGVADKTVLLICAWAAMAGAPLVLSAYENEGKEAASEQGKGLAQTLLLIAMPAAFGIAAVATPLAEVMIGPSLREQATEIIPWIAFAGLFNGFMVHFYSEAFQVAKRTLESVFIMIVPTTANIILNIILLPMIGVMGAVYATLGCYILAVIMLAVIGRRYLPMPIPFIDLIKVLLACSLMVGTVMLVPAIGGLPELIMKAVAGGTIYGVVVFALNAAGARDFARRFRNRDDNDVGISEETA